MIINTKKFLPLLLLFLCTLSLTPIYAADIPSTMEYQGTKLMLNGHGPRVKMLMKVYENSLYLEAANSNAEEIMNKDAAMAIRIDVTSSLVTVDAMKKALNEGLVKSTGNNTGPIMKEIDQLTSTFNSDVSTGDFYEFIYLPDAGTYVLKNSEYIDTIPGIEFKKAFFGIWISNNPIQKNLKKAMLGG
ncbi:MAG: chalcone isomerase family protein [Candidatus Pseudothioglobus sp.]